MNEFYTSLQQTIIAGADANENFQNSIFTDYACGILEDQGVIPDYALTEYRKESKGLRVDAWSFDKEADRINLIVCDFSTTTTPETLTKTQLTQAFKRPERFFYECLKDKFRSSLEESDPATALAWEVWEHRKTIHSIKLIFVTNKKISERVSELPTTDERGHKLSYDVWDITRFKQLEESGKAREAVEIDLSTYTPDGLPCLQAHSDAVKVESYLLVLPGEILAELYEQYGERLLEQNVRTFLQFRGKVNKGMRNTLGNEPEMFFPFNNGLTATAENVEICPTSNNILKIKNLQIVNGGQTTASVYMAKRKHKLDISKVYIQVKLSVVSPDVVEEIVPKISEYANTQNKVNAADFFSNHPYHRRIEEMSRRLLSPPKDGAIHQTFWFYERSRGQYANAQAALTPAEQKKFLKQNPRDQMFVKTDLAKAVNTFEGKPDLVSKGAQKSFAAFAADIGSLWEKKEHSFNDLYFKDSVSKLIIFRALDKCVRKAPWYKGGYKANIVTYTIARVAREVTAMKKFLPLSTIWDKQEVPACLLEDLLRIGDQINDLIQKTPAGVTNVTEWCKREACWQTAQQEQIFFSPETKALLVDKEQRAEKVKDAGRNRKMLSGIEAVNSVAEKGAEYWCGFLDWNEKTKKLAHREVGVLNVAACYPSKIPTEKQAKVILEAENRALEFGYPEVF